VPIQTVFLDAGGVLVNPNWSRVSETLARHGVQVSAAALAAAEPGAKKRIDTHEIIKTTMDRERGWSYFNVVLTEAAVALSEATAAALAELQLYHMQFNLWESVPDEVIPSLAALRASGFKLVVASNANGVLHRSFDRLGLTAAVDVVVDSFLEGVEKPDPRFFQIALDRSGSRPETTIHIGDLYHVDVAGARAAGITPALLDVAGLYPECDCLRVRSLSELVASLQMSRPASAGPRGSA
jgi:HAD superfamily hydrolase (TIGR01509 family)